ncbi:MAG: hypothetical protein GWO11_06190 [Desulfuromonadales bacterium]|nr:hypothetical protein [Desulfuromonadales bacterium]NIR33959.1 hypothetical protein [Desulfuromonadales bacterium]NIS41507.1 hypothetical protein [Desulfuromonadales bacterium]
MRILLASVVILMCIQLGGCLYIDAKIPYDTDLQETSLGDKTGEASTHSVLWLFAWGDAGVEEAARNGGIERIDHMDREIFVILFGLYSRTTTVVYGE